MRVYSSLMTSVPCDFAPLRCPAVSPVSRFDANLDDPGRSNLRASKVGGIACAEVGGFERVVGAIVGRLGASIVTRASSS